MATLWVVAVLIHATSIFFTILFTSYQLIAHTPTVIVNKPSYYTFPVQIAMWFPSPERTLTDTVAHSLKRPFSTARSSSSIQPPCQVITACFKHSQQSRMECHCGAGHGVQRPRLLEGHKQAESLAPPAPGLHSAPGCWFSPTRRAPLLSSGRASILLPRLHSGRPSRPHSAFSYAPNSPLLSYMGGNECSPPLQPLHL